MLQHAFMLSLQDIQSKGRQDIHHLAPSFQIMKHNKKKTTNTMIYLNVIELLNQLNINPISTLELQHAEHKTHV
jgi:hypothetical protein